MPNRTPPTSLLASLLAPLLALLLTLGACSTYDFAQARRADGSYDVPKLIAELRQSGRDSMGEGTWIPLVYLDLVSFGKTRPPMVEGYHLIEFTSYAPLFCAGSREEWYFDANGQEVERGDREWVGWGVLYHDRDDYVQTTHGTRHEGRERIALLFGSSVLAYWPEPAR